MADQHHRFAAAAAAAACSPSAPPLRPLGSFSGATPTAGFAFGAKYVGQVAAAVPGAAAAASTADAGGARAAAAAIIPPDLDGEVAQQLQKLSKRDATTKLKALQVRSAPCW